MVMQDSIFTKIIKGEIPCHKIYEDDKTLAFLDIRPIQPGHVLVIPKSQVGFVWDMDSDDYRALMDTVQKVGKRLKEVYPEKARVGVIIEGLDVEDHAHIKVFPFNDDKKFRFVPDPKSQADDTSLAKVAKKLAF